MVTTPPEMETGIALHDPERTDPTVSTLLSRCRPQYPWTVLLYLVPALLFVTLSLHDLTDHDTWLHLKVGELIVREHQIPRSDPFSETVAGQPWMNLEWLSQLGFYLIYRLVGVSGLIIFALLVLGLAFLAFSLVSLELHKPFLGAALLTLSVFAAAERFIPRPEIFSYLWLGVFFFILHAYRHRRLHRFILILPFLQVLWENLHGGTLLGMEVVGAYAAGQSLLRWLPVPAGWKTPEMERARYHRLLLVLALTLLACLINPWHGQNLLASLELRQHQFSMTTIAEWQRTFSVAPPWPPEIQAYFVLAILCGTGFVLNFRRLDLNHLILFLGLLILSLLARRHIALFALAALPITAWNWARMGEAISLRWRVNSGRFGRMISAARIAAMAALVLASLHLGWRVITNRYYLDHSIRERFGWGISSTVYPWPLLDFLEQNQLSGFLFNNYDLGNFMIWRLWPRYRPFLDTRAVLYDPDFLQDYTDALVSAQAWKDLADRYQVQVVALLHLSLDVADFLPLLAQDPEWVPVYLDESGVIFVRDRPENAPCIARHRLDLSRRESLSFAAPARNSSPRRFGLFASAADPLHENDAALFFLNTGRLDQAEPLLRKALAVDPGNSLASTNLAALLCRQGRWLEAEDWARRAVARSPGEVEPYLHLAEALYHQERYAESIQANTRALRRDPNNYTGLHNRGLTLARLGRYSEALPDLKKAFSLQPDDPSACRELALLYDRRQNPLATPTWQQCLVLTIKAGAAPEEMAFIRARLEKSSR